MVAEIIWGSFPVPTFCSLRSQGASCFSFAPGPLKSLGGPEYRTIISDINFIFSRI